jgi:methionyl-tRNA formyltransferase
MKLRIAIISDAASWMAPYIAELAARWRKDGHDVSVGASARHDAVDIAFFLSFGQIATSEVLSRARSNIVVHGSALPAGKGWSPWSWQILEGRNRLALTLFEAQDGVDSGPIYDQRWVDLEGHELIDEWQHKQAETTIGMCADFVADFPAVLDRAKAQTGPESVYARRRPEDSRLDPNRSLSEQFGLLRIVDNARYPAFFELEGHTYVLTIVKRDS